MIEKKEFTSTDDTSEGSSVHHDDHQALHHTATPRPSEEYISLDGLDHHSDKKMASLRLVIPTYLDNQLTQIAAGKRVTKRYLILKALSDAGYRIEKEDLVADKRRVR